MRKTRILSAIALLVPLLVSVLMWPQARPKPSPQDAELRHSSGSNSPMPEIDRSRFPNGGKGHVRITEE